MRYFWVLFSCLFISACGWHLRGSTADYNFSAVEVGGQFQLPEQYRILNEMLISQGLSADQNTPDLHISLLDETTSRRTIAIGSNALAAEYELTLKVRYSIEDNQGETLLRPTWVEQRRSYNFDRNDVIALEREQALITREMRTQIAQRILTKLRFLKVDTAAHSEATPPVEQSL